jgi:hypothetical protein
MPKFEDTPKWKRKLRWNPDIQQLVIPPTPKQLSYLRDLCERKGVEYVEPHSREAATRFLKALKRKGRRRRRRR